MEGALCPSANLGCLHDNFGIRGLFPFWAQKRRPQGETFGPSAPEGLGIKEVGQEGPGETDDAVRVPDTLFACLSLPQASGRNNIITKPTTFSTGLSYATLAAEKSADADSCVNLIRHARPSLFYYIHSAL